MEYPESVATKTWDYKGTTCSIVLNERLGHYCGYVRFAANPFARGGPVEAFLDYVPVHGGITYHNGNVFGYDCGHCDDKSNPDLRDIEWLTKHTEAFADALIAAKPVELRYRRLRTNKSKATLLDEYRDKYGASVEMGFGAILRGLSGQL